MKYLNIFFKKKYVIKYIEIKLKNIFERIIKQKIIETKCYVDLISN